jgi:hypothetical protein
VESSVDIDAVVVIDLFTTLLLVKETTSFTFLLTNSNISSMKRAWSEVARKLEARKALS